MGDCSQRSGFVWCVMSSLGACFASLYTVQRSDAPGVCRLEAARMRAVLVYIQYANGSDGNLALCVLR